jgi:hypothetical protein
MMIRYLKHIISSKYNQIRWEINFAPRLKTIATLTKMYSPYMNTLQKPHLK